MLDKDSGKPFKCKDCDYSSNRSFDLRRHEQRHTKMRQLGEGDVFNCSECFFTTKWKRNISRHMKIHTKTAVEEPVEDPVEEPAEEENFEEFIVELIGDSETTANEDPQVPAPQSTDSEKLGITRMKFFVCGQCQYTTNRTFDMRRHELIHLKEKIIDGTGYKCLKCSFVTKWKRNMNRHVKKHLEFSSKVYVEQSSDKSPGDTCVQQSNSDDARSEYESDPVDNIHSDNSQSQASLPFTQPLEDQPDIQIIPTPKKKADGTRRFKCDQCNYESKRAFDLRRHEQRHKKVKIVDGKAIKCPECSFVTKWKRNMRRHMQQHKPRSVSLEESILDEQLEELVGEDNCNEETEFLSIEPLESESVVLEYNCETIPINEEEFCEEIDSELEFKMLESDEDSEVLPSYWDAI